MYLHIHYTLQWWGKSTGGYWWTNIVFFVNNSNGQLNFECRLPEKFKRNNALLLYHRDELRGHFNGINMTHRRTLSGYRIGPHLMWCYCCTARIQYKKRTKNVKDPNNTQIYLSADDYLLIKDNTNLIGTIYNNNARTNFYYNCIRFTDIV